MTHRTSALLGVVMLALVCTIGCSSTHQMRHQFDYLHQQQELAGVTYSPPQITRQVMPDGSIKVHVHQKVHVTKPCPGGYCPLKHKTSKPHIATGDDVFSTATTLAQARDAINSYIEALGENAPICVMVPGTEDQVDNLVTFDWICVEQETSKIIGSEAIDTEMNLQPGQVNAIRIS